MREYDYFNRTTYEANKMLHDSNPNKRWKPRFKSKWLIAAVVVIVGIAVIFGAVKLLEVIRAGM